MCRLPARRRGQVLLATVNEATMVPFVSGQLGNLELALALARRSNLPGAEALVGQNFERLFAAGQFKEAAEAAAESPQVRAPLQQAGVGVQLAGQMYLDTSRCLAAQGGRQRSTRIPAGVSSLILGLAIWPEER